ACLAGNDSLRGGLFCCLGFGVDGKIGSLGDSRNLGVHLSQLLSQSLLALVKRLQLVLAGRQLTAEGLEFGGFLGNATLNGFERLGRHGLVATPGKKVDWVTALVR